LPDARKILFRQRASIQCPIFRRIFPVSLLALNMDLASVTREGRWTTVRMPMRYGEHVMAARGGMARAAEAQGSDKR
jgi:hypothetical protein